MNLFQDQIFNYIDIKNNVFIEKCSSYNETTKPENILDLSYYSFWVSKDFLPQEIIISLKNIIKYPKPFPKYFGIFLMNKMETNPQIIEILFSLDKKIYVSYGEFNLKFQRGLQIFKLYHPIRKFYEQGNNYEFKYNYLKIIIKKTFGRDRRVYINKVFLFDEKFEKKEQKKYIQKINKDFIINDNENNNNKTNNFNNKNNVINYDLDINNENKEIDIKNINYNESNNNNNNIKNESVLEKNKKQNFQEQLTNQINKLNEIFSKDGNNNIKNQKLDKNYFLKDNNKIIFDNSYSNIKNNKKLNEKNNYENDENYYKLLYKNPYSTIGFQKILNSINLDIDLEKKNKNNEDKKYIKNLKNKSHYNLYYLYNEDLLKYLIKKNKQIEKAKKICDSFKK